MKSYYTPVPEGTYHDVTIEDVARDGDGIARVQGFVIFVPGTKIGDNVKIKIDMVMRLFAIASVIQEESKPEITLKFPEETFKPNTWKRIAITITNTGSIHAKNIKIKPSSDIEFRRIPTIPQIDANETKTMIIGMKPTVRGDVPIDIVITFNDAFDREYTSLEELWVMVVVYVDVRTSFDQRIFPASGAIGIPIPSCSLFCW